MPLEILILLALIQGLTEFLPISSSAHLILPAQLGLIEDQGTTIDVAVHVGSLFAVMLYFYRDIGMLLRGLLDAVQMRWSRDARLLAFLCLATVPFLVLGVGVAVFDVEDVLRSAELIGWTSIIFGLVLYEADRIALRYKTMEDITWRGAITVGLAQCLAALPGTSRSGITMTAGRFLGYTRSEAARFSMLLAIPTILAAGGYKGLQVITGADPVALDAILWSVGLSFVAAYLSIWVFMTLVERIGLLPFVIYRVFLGIGLLGYVYLAA
ncbi:MAG: undecaprenyl-diphosphate phosphatase [Alphaproteobacteria bacterium]